MIPTLFKEASQFFRSGSFLLFLILSIIAFSCQDEFTQPDTPEAQTFQADSEVANLMMRIAMKDGSADDIVDGSSALSLEFPFALLVNEEKIVIASKTDYSKIEAALNKEVEDKNSLELIFPVTVRLPDYQTIAISDYSQLSILSNQYGEGPGSNPGITCVDIQYPVNFSFSNPVTQDEETYSIANDQELFEFLDSLENDYQVDLDFPLSVILSDGTPIILEDLLQLEGTLNEYRDSCQDEAVPEEVVEEDTEGKVAICHKTGNGFKTIYVDPPAVKAHLGHGDILGACKDEDEDEDEDDDDEDDEDADNDDDDDDEDDDEDDEDDEDEDEDEDEDDDEDDEDDDNDDDDDDDEDDEDDDDEDDDDDDDDDDKTGN